MLLYLTRPLLKETSSLATALRQSQLNASFFPPTLEYHTDAIFDVQLLAP